MDNERSILCLEHCKNFKIFGFSIPLTCSNCGSDLRKVDLRIPPFRIPTPFHDAKATPCAIVLKPTTGDFLTDYKNSDNLHIGVTSSEGIVYEFDVNGLKSDKTSQWTRCLTIQDLNKLNRTKDSALISSWNKYWDFTLDVVARQSDWRKDKYDETTHNCYTFVLNFLRDLQIQNVSNLARDRRLFCREFILPKTATAAKYITLYRKLLNEL